MLAIADLICTHERMRARGAGFGKNYRPIRSRRQGQFVKGAELKSAEQAYARETVRIRSVRLRRSAKWVGAMHAAGRMTVSPIPRGKERKVRARKVRGRR